MGDRSGTPRTPVRTRLSPEDRRAQLIALGVESLVEHPLHDLSIESLAKRAGVSRALLFHYFGSKQGLHRAVVQVARDSMLHATEPESGRDPLDRLHDTLTRIVRFVREHRGTFYSLVRGVASGDAEVREVVEEARVEQANRVLSVFLELGLPDTPLLRVAMRSWVAFTEEMLVEAAAGSAIESARGSADEELADAELVAFLVRSAVAVAEAVRQGVP
jgi:AcrR family transcriptional regulator